MNADPLRCPRCGSPLLEAGAPCLRCLLNESTADDAEKTPGKTGLEPLPEPWQVLVIADRYRVIETLGQGGMGRVYKAWQENLKRVVAVKVIKSGRFAGAQERQRFAVEAKAAARLKHPGIMAVYDWGEHEGQPYYSMEYVEGESLEAVIERGPVPWRRSAEVVQAVAEAIGCAHEQGVLHRDLKPSNILLDRSGTVKVSDFGMAKLTDASVRVTETEDVVLGSVLWMPPEQGDSKWGKTGVWSDVYGLGAILYHLLTGRPPYQGDTELQVLAQVTDGKVEPVRPRRLNAGVPADLETICLKCLEKEPKRRYATAQEVADELGRWLRDEPIRVRPAGPVEKAWKWCRRRPALATVIVLSSLMVLASLLLAASWRRAGEAAMELRRQKNAGFLAAAERIDPPGLSLLFLAQALRVDPGATVAAQRLLNALSYRAFPVPLASVSAESNRIVAARYSPDGQKLLTACLEGELRVWDATSFQPLTRHWSHSNGLSQVNFNRDGTRLYSIRYNPETQDQGQARVWRTDTGSPDSPPLELESKSALLAAEFAADDRSLLTLALDGTVTRWAAGSGQAQMLLAANTNTDALALSPDGRWFAYATGRREAWIADAEAGRVLAGPLNLDQPCRNLSMDPRGTLLLSIGVGGHLQLWAAASGRLLATNSSVPNARAAYFSPDASFMLVQLGGTESQLLDATNLTPRGVPFTNYEPFAVPFRPDGKALVLRYDRAWRVWDTVTGLALADPGASPGVIEDVAWSPDGRRVIACDSSSSALISDFYSPALAARPVGLISVSDFSPDGRWAVVVTNTSVDTGGAARGTVITLHDIEEGKPVGEPLRHATRVSNWAFSSNQQQLATIAADSKLRVWSVGTGTTHEFGPLTNVTTAPAFSPDGRWLGIGGADTWWLVDLATSAAAVESFRLGTNVKSDPQWGGSPAARDLQFSPDGRLLATGLELGFAEVWDLTARTRKIPIMHKGPVASVRFSPDGRKLLTASFDGTARLSNAATGQRLITLVHGQPIAQAVFAPNGRHVITLGGDWVARVWEAETGVLLGTARLPNDQVRAIGFDPRGDCLVTFSAGGFLRLWDTESVTPLGEPVPDIWRWAGARFAANGQLLAVAATNQAVVEINPLRPRGPAPEWLPRLAEAVLGLAYSEQGGLDRLMAPELLDLRRKISSLPGTDFYSRWGRWYFAAAEQRGPPPLPQDR